MVCVIGIDFFVFFIEATTVVLEVSVQTITKIYCTVSDT